MKSCAATLGFGLLRPGDVPGNRGETGHRCNSLKHGGNSHRGYTPETTAYNARVSYGVSVGTVLESGPSPKLAENPAATAPMPDGYDADVSSTATLQASESLLFSVPLNHLSGKWHIEIPFRFDVPHERPLHYEANIGGQPRMAIGYWLSDLPQDARKRVEAGVKYR